MVTLRPTDLRQFLYCPRILYFTYVQPVRRLPTLKMLDGIEQHRREAKLERQGRRRYRDLPHGERSHNVWLSSPALGLAGRVDMLLTLANGEIVPVELKQDTKLERRHQYQLIAYALLATEQYGAVVRTCYLQSLISGRAVAVTVTARRIKFVLDTVAAMRRMIKDEAFPRPTRGYQGAKCHDCEYRRYCGDC